MLLLLAVTLLGCDPLTDGDDLAPDPLDQPGPWAAGATSLPLDLDGHEVLAEVWYPTARRPDATLWSYFLGYTRAAVEASAPTCVGTRPVVVFSHGNGGVRFQDIFLAEHLATHGYVVVAPDHADNTAFDLDEDLTGRVALRRPDDVARAFDLVAADPLTEDCVDPDDGYAVVGHSFGGWTALAVSGASLDLEVLADTCGDDRGWLCQLLDLPEAAALDLSDPRVWATVPHAPAGYETFGPVGMAGLATPTFILGASDDTLTPWEEHQVPMYEGLVTTPRALARLEGASHYTFSDSCALFPIGEFCEGDIELALAHRLINAMTLAWLESVRGTDDGEADVWLPPAGDAVVFEETR